MSERKIKRRKLSKYAIGDLRDRISLEQRSITPPVFNSIAFTEGYVQIDEVWASVETINKGNYQPFNDVSPQNDSATHRIVIRFRADVTTETRIRWKNNLYEIVDSSDPQERDQYLVLKCKLLGADPKEANQ